MESKEYSFAQQAVHILRQCLSMPGVAKTPDEFYRDGELLVDVLPEPDLSWQVSEKELASKTAAERKTYKDEAKKWGDTQGKFTLTEKQRERVRAVLKKVSEMDAVANGKYTFAVFKAFGFKPEAA